MYHKLLRYLLPLIATAGAVVATPASALASFIHTGATAGWWPSTPQSYGTSATLSTSKMNVPDINNDFVTNEIWAFANPTQSAWVEAGVTMGASGTGSCDQYINGVETSPCNPSGPTYQATWLSPTFFWAKKNDSGGYFEHYYTHTAVTLNHDYQASVHNTSGSTWEVALYDGYPNGKVFDETTGNVTPGSSTGGSYAGIEGEYDNTNSSGLKDGGYAKDLKYWSGSAWTNWTNNTLPGISQFPGSVYGCMTATWNPQPSEVDTNTTC